MTATQILAVLAIMEALTPTITLFAQGIKEMTGEDIDPKKMTVEELMALKDRLLKTHPDNWPDLKFKTPGN